MRFLCLLVSLAFGALPVFGTRKSYNETLAWQLLHMAAASYGEEKGACLQKAFPREDYRILLPFSAECDRLWDTCAGFIAVSDVEEKLIFAFRGTNEFTQLVDEAVTGLLSALVPFSDWGMVNMYFNRGADALWPQIEGVLSNPDYEDYDFIFTGHSLGGALAVLAAARTVAEGIHASDQITVYTFGEPRVGDYAFAQKYDEMIKNSYRVVHRDDIVPHLPPCHPLFLYILFPSLPCSHKGMHHHGTEIWYEYSMEPRSQYKVCTREEDSSCSDQVSFISKLGKDISDHLNYFDADVSDYGKKGCNSETAWDLVKDDLCFLLRINCE